MGLLFFLPRDGILSSYKNNFYIKRRIYHETFCISKN